MTKWSNKRRLLRLITYLFLFGFVVIFVYTALNYEALRLLFGEEIQLYGPLALFLGGFLFDAVAGPLGPEIPITGGLLAGIDLTTALSTVILGSALATLMVYSAGYFLGESWVLSHWNPDRYHHWRERFLKHRRLTVIMGALTPIPHDLVCLIAGSFKMKFFEFLVLAMGSRIVRISAAAYVVYILQQII